MTDCIFCKIISGEIPSKKVYESDSVVAFLDINPANKGHVLVASKRHFENIFDITDSSLKDLVCAVKMMAKRIKSKLGTDAINIVQNNGKYAGQLVNHIHFHVIPRYPNDRVIITYQRAHLTDAEMADAQKKLSEEISDFDI